MNFIASISNLFSVGDVIVTVYFLIWVCLIIVVLRLIVHAVKAIESSSQALTEIANQHHYLVQESKNPPTPVSGHPEAQQSRKITRTTPARR